MEEVRSWKRLCHNHDSVSQQGRYRAARAAKNWIFNKDDIRKELCAPLYTLEEVMSQLRIKSGRSGR